MSIKVTTYARYEMTDSGYTLVEEQSFPYEGRIEWACGGASGTQEELSTSEANFYNTLTQDYNTQFANQSGILQSLDAVAKPIYAAGPNQTAWASPGGHTEEVALNTAAKENTTANFAAQEQALGEEQAASGGGNAFIPAGSKESQMASLAGGEASTLANQETAINQEGFTLGNQEFNEAAGILGGVAGFESPTSYSNAATGAASPANSEANTVQTANNELGSTVGGILGGALGGGISLPSGLSI